MEEDESVKETNGAGNEEQGYQRDASYVLEPAGDDNQENSGWKTVIPFKRKPSSSKHN